MSFSQAWSFLLLGLLFRFALKLAEICILCWYSQGSENNCQISASIKCRLQIYSPDLFLAAAFWVLLYVLLACKDCTSYFHRNLIVWGRETLEKVVYTYKVDWKSKDLIADTVIYIFWLICGT